MSSTDEKSDEDDDTKKSDDKENRSDNENGDKKEEDKSKSSDDDKDKDEKGDKDEKEEKKPKGPPIYKKPAFIITVIIVLIVLVVGGIILWLYERQYVSTDDAYIDGHIVEISPQVSARVQALHIVDNQFVHKGDLLVELDKTDYNVAMTQAKAQIDSSLGRLEQARAQVIAAQASVPQALAQKRAAEASLEKASKDLERYQKVDERARSKQQLDDAGTAQTNAQAQVAQAEAQVASSQANVGTAEAAVKAAQGELEASEASKKRAEVNLSYCEITAPIDGRITERTVEAGNYVTPGQALFMLVDPNVWITANFKETQLTHLQPGQPVTIKIDAFPGTKLQGHVESIQAGSGSRFSLLPAENATGNYVKIVQRVPVKIIFEHDANTNNAPMLSPGLSVIPRVKVR